jgi:predicted DNA-binding transcriptional regulator AlpA
MHDQSWRLSYIARYLGVSKQRAHQLAAEGRLPSPAGEDHRGRYWRPSEVRAWARKWERERPWRALSLK